MPVRWEARIRVIKYYIKASSNDQENEVAEWSDMRDR